jgi:hypothetical protein
LHQCAVAWRARDVVPKLAVNTLVDCNHDPGPPVLAQYRPQGRLLQPSCE